MNYIIEYIQSCNEHNALRVAKYTINPEKKMKKKIECKISTSYLDVKCFKAISWCMKYSVKIIKTIYCMKISQCQYQHNHNFKRKLFYSNQVFKYEKCPEIIISMYDTILNFHYVLI